MYTHKEANCKNGLMSFIFGHTHPGSLQCKSSRPTLDKSVIKYRNNGNIACIEYFEEPAFFLSLEAINIMSQNRVDRPHSL